MWRIMQIYMASVDNSLRKKIFWGKYIPSNNLVSQQLYYRIDAHFPKYGKRRLVMKNLLGDKSQPEKAKYFEWMNE